MLTQNYTCGDCNDDNNTINPTVNETCYDGIDNNCNGVVDEGCVPLICQNSTDSDMDSYKANMFEEIPAATGPSQQQTPDVYKNTIAYQDHANGKWNIYLYDIESGIITQATNDTQNENLWPAVYKNGVVYEKLVFGPGTTDIWMYNATTDTNTPIANRTGDQKLPDIYENYITYWDHTPASPDANIYLYDQKTKKERKITSTPTATIENNHGPRIHNNLAVWSDKKDGNTNIYLYDINKNKTLQVTNVTYAWGPDVYQNTITWYDEGIWKRTYTSTTQTLGKATLVLNKSSVTQPARIYGSQITYQDDNDQELYQRDHTTNTTKQLTKNAENDYTPKIDTDIITYTKNGVGKPYDIYYINTSAEVICGDCDDENKSINSNSSNENSTINQGVCTNGIDDNCNGLIDCDDPSCADDSFCNPKCDPREDLCTFWPQPCCNNGKDDDCDTLFDCSDSDCGNDLACSGNATLHGFVFDDQGWHIDLATVTGYPPFKPIVATFTDIVGFYNFTVPSGVYTFKADKFGYDPDIDELTLLNGTDNEHNFTLQNATCHVDCTNSENRCNKDCEGYTYQGDQCHYNSTTVANACQDKRKGTTQTLATNESNYLLVDCCEGNPYYQWKPQLTVHGPMEDLYKLTSIVSIGGDPAKLHVNVWRK
ncbi:MAG: MopE-related protein [Nanoarchaeota archaeon]